MPLSPIVQRRLQAVAMEIESNARSAARRPHNMVNFRPFSWPFNAYDLTRILERHGLTVTETKGTTP